MSSRSRTTTLVIVLLLLALIALLLFRRCASAPPVAPAKAADPSPKPLATAAENPAPAPKPPEEVLTPATLQTPPRIDAGATFHVAWTGPDNPGDYLTIVRPDVAPSVHGWYAETRKGATLDLLAPQDAGDWEVRYIAARSKTVLARVRVIVDPIGAAITAPAEVVAGAKFQVTWQGPNHRGDYLTIVPEGTPDGQYRNYADAAKGSPLELLALIDTGAAEVRYVTGTEHRVLARRPIRIVSATVSLDAPSEVIAGATVSIVWTGPANNGDYLTIVPKTARDGEHGNYTDVAKGSPMKFISPMQPGLAEIRYMSGQGAKVLGRREIRIVAAEVSVSAPTDVVAGSLVAVEWSGPNNPGDYLTIVPRAAKDGVASSTVPTSRGSPVKVGAPKEPGPGEIRYMSGQGHLVLARRAIEIK